MIQADVPSPVDFHLMRDAKAWESTAMDRPYRLDMFKCFSAALEASNAGAILEIGSGPGFLAEHLCSHISNISLTLLDFSHAMHELAKKRLEKHSHRVSFVERNFKDQDWSNGLGTFDNIITNQAVHELRHKKHVSTFHAQVGELLNPCGTYLLCDHFYGEGGMQNDQLYMTVDEQLSSLDKAGFEAEVLLKKGSLVLVQATIP